ncbi:MAG: hypothetical protein ACRC92_26495 [Peptostreptococcaceae bacterium]
MKIVNMKDFIIEGIETLHDASAVIESIGDQDDKHVLQSIDSTLSGLLNMKSNMEAEIPTVDLPRIINTSQLISMGVSKEDIDALPVSYYAVTSEDLKYYVKDVVPTEKLDEVKTEINNNSDDLYNKLNVGLSNAINGEVIADVFAEQLTDILGYNPTDL